MSTPLKHSPEVLDVLVDSDLMRLSDILPSAFGSISVANVAEFVPLAIGAPSADVLVSRDSDGQIASTMVVNVTYGLGKVRGRIDDVATYEDSRRRGHAAAVLDFAIDWFRVRGVYRVNLTSNDDRKPAHGLYISRGFEIKETNQFQLDL